MKKQDQREHVKEQFKVCTLVLILSSIILTTIKVVFAAPAIVADKKSSERRQSTNTDKKKYLRKRRNSVDNPSLLIPPTLESSFCGRSKHRAVSVDGRSVVSSVPSYGSPLNKRTMNEVRGVLQKQGDVFGFWKQRYFELVSLNSLQLSEIKNVSKTIFDPDDPSRKFVLLYWTKKDQSIKNSKSPRGAFLLEQCIVEKDQLDLVFVLKNLIDAMDPEKKVPPIKLCGKNTRSMQRWVSALSFASLISFKRDEPTIVPRLTGNLSIIPRVSSNASFMYQFKLYRKEKSEQEYTSRVFLMCWDPSREDTSQSITPQSIFEVTDSIAKIDANDNAVLSIQKISNVHPFNRFVTRGEMILKASSSAEASVWADEISSKQKQTTSSTLMALSLSEEATIDEYTPNVDECVVDELNASQLLAMDYSALSTCSSTSENAYRDLDTFTPTSIDVLEGFDDIENRSFESNTNNGNYDGEMQTQYGLKIGSLSNMNLGRLSPVTEEDSESHASINTSAEFTASNWKNRRRSLEIPKRTSL